MNDESDQEETQLLQLMVDDPYAILKVDRDASDVMIQSSYKTLSRTFHPDKHPPGPTRDAAQQVFVKFKNAHDLLMDPVLRLVYDDCGHDATVIVRRTMHSSNPEALYPTLLRFHQRSQRRQARNYVAKALLQANVDAEDRALQIRTTMDFPCSIQSTAFSGEGDEPLDIPEQSAASISVTTSAASDSKWDMSVGVNSSVKRGTGSASGTVNVGYKPQKGTQISSSVDLVDPMIFTLSTSRALESRSVVMTSVRTIPHSKKLALSLVSHRDLWDNMFRGSWALGIGSDLSMQYGLISLTTLSDEYPTCSVKLNLGVNQYPIKIVTKQDFGLGRSGLLSFAWQPRGVEWKAILSRSLTSYSNVSMGIQHQTSTGLTWLLQAERGNFTFRIPISICCVTNPTYRMSFVWFSLLTLILDDVLGDLIHDTTQDGLKPTTDHDTTSAEAAEASIVKEKSDADQQLVLMRPTAERNMEREQECNGLYIYQAQYFVDQGGPSVDVATQLQFWVRNSTLCLPAGSKSSMLGFYQLLPPVSSPQRRRFSWLRSWLWNDVPHDAQPVPQLRIRYTFRDETYEITVDDTDELVLPSPNATTLGSKDRVR